jgi:hypothetical protein
MRPRPGITTEEHEKEVTEWSTPGIEGEAFYIGKRTVLQDLRISYSHGDGLVYLILHEPGVRGRSSSLRLLLFRFTDSYSTIFGY